MDLSAAPALAWAAAALARLSRVPEVMRETTRERIQAVARERGAAEVDLEIVEAGLAEAREAMHQAMLEGGHKRTVDEPQADAGEAGGCPFAALRPAEAEERPAADEAPLEWTAEAEERMADIPEGFMRTLTRRRLEVFARRHGVGAITPALVDEKYAEWAEGSAKQRPTLKWRQTALARVDGIPGFVRGMVILEIERCAAEMGSDTVTDEVIDRAMETWQASGVFHSEADPDLYGQG
jgi:hypothetical protein